MAVVLLQQKTEAAEREAAETVEKLRQQLLDLWRERHRERLFKRMQMVQQKYQEIGRR